MESDSSMVTIDYPSIKRGIYSKVLYDIDRIAAITEWNGQLSSQLFSHVPLMHGRASSARKILSLCSSDGEELLIGNCTSNWYYLGIGKELASASRKDLVVEGETIETKEFVILLSRGSSFHWEGIEPERIMFRKVIAAKAFGIFLPYTRNSRTQWFFIPE